MEQMESELTEYVDTIAHTPLFAGVDMQVLHTILKTCELRSLHVGDVLLDPRQPNARLFVLLKGKLHVCMTRSNRTFLSIVEPGDYVGEVSLWDQQSPTAYVFAQMDSVVLSLSREQLTRIIQCTDTVCFNLLRIQAERFRRHTEMLKTANEKLRHLRLRADTDSLTGLRNRVWFFDVMKSQLEVCDRADQEAVLAMLDIDHFKQVNDTYGHPAGDAMLCAVANVLAKSFRSNDLLARFGGEEFIIFLVGTPLESAIRVLEKLLQTIEALRVSLSDGRVIRCTASIGATELHHGEEVETLISRADSMLYRAKHNGRNQLQVSSQFATVVYDYEH